MGQKQILQRTQIAKMSGHEKTHFLNPRVKRVTNALGDLGGLQHLGFHLVTLPVGSVASEFHRHVCEEECVYIVGNGTARIGPDTFEVEADDFIAHTADGEEHNLRNTGLSSMTCIVVGQRLDFDVVDYLEQNKRLYRYAGKARDLVDVAAVSHPILPNARR